MAHEKNSTIGTDRGTFVVPTVVKGQTLSKDEVLKRFRAGDIKPIAGPFGSLGAAERFIQKRSREAGAEPGPRRSPLKRRVLRRKRGN